ncbi:MAG: hypothetical protein PHQ28_00735 [Mycobacterium sp.]|nr:hypothetical protein [Mycobacterium sp.]
MGVEIGGRGADSAMLMAYLDAACGNGQGHAWEFRLEPPGHLDHTHDSAPLAL